MRWFLSRLLCPLLKIELPLIENVIKPLAKSVLIPLGLTAAASAGDPQIHKKILASGRHHSFTFSLSSAPKTTTLIISSDKIKDLTEIVKSLEDFGLLLKEVSELIQNELKEQKRGFLSMLLGILGAILLWNILAGKGINRAREGAIAKRQGQGIVKASYGNKKGQKATTKNKTGF